MADVSLSGLIGVHRERCRCMKVAPACYMSQCSRANVIRRRKADVS
jgi:hypothetical protein